MGGKAVIAAGLVTGAVAGAILVGAVVLLAPGPVAPVLSPTAAPSDPPSAPPSAAPSASPAASPSAAPSTSTTPGTGAFGVGEPAPPLTVPQLGGGEVALTGLKGKPVWVNFMATWCPSCQDEIPLMNRFAARYAEQGLVVVAVDVREAEPLVEAFAKGLSITFPVGLDKDGTAQSDWGAYALPVHFWVDADGIVRYGALGGIGPDIMAEGLQTILPGVTVTP